MFSSWCHNPDMNKRILEEKLSQMFKIDGWHFLFYDLFHLQKKYHQPPVSKSTLIVYVQAIHLFTNSNL